MENTSVENLKIIQHPEQLSVIGVGLGGSNLARDIAKKFSLNKFIVLNTSNQDNRSQIDDSIRPTIIGLNKGSGAGKDSDVGKAILKENLFSLVGNDEFLPKLFTPFTKIIIICYSLAGGTGSGIGPILSNIIAGKDFIEQGYTKSDRNESLPIHRKYDAIIEGEKIETYFNDEINHSPGFNPDALVIQIPILPSNGESGMSFTNAVKSLETIKEIQANHNQITTFFVDNKNVSMNNPEINYKESLISINDNVAQILYRYFQEYSHSPLGNLDPNDRLKALSFGGIHVLANLNEIGVFDKNENTEDKNIEKIDVEFSDDSIKSLEIESQFFIPSNGDFKVLALEVREKYNRIILPLTKKFNISYKESIPGFINKNNSYITNIMHYASCNAFNVLIEIYGNLLKEINNSIEQSDKIQLSKKSENHEKNFAQWGLSSKEIHKKGDNNNLMNLFNS